MQEKNSFPPKRNQIIVKTRSLCKYYHQGEDTVKALHNIELKIHSSDWVAVTGSSGSGKSTLLNLIGLLDTPTSGEIFFGDSHISNLSQKNKINIRLRCIGFVFQFFNLQTNLTTLENVMLPSWMASGDREKSVEKAKQLLERVGLGNRLNHLPSQLSGGQQQRAAIARALVNNPELILADEPTGNLDSGSSMEIMDIFREINESGHTIIMVTHEKDIAELADLEITLLDGEIRKSECV